MTYGHLQADCLYTGISSGPNTWCQVWESLYLYLYAVVKCINGCSLCVHNQWLENVDVKNDHPPCVHNTVPRSRRKFNAKLHQQLIHWQETFTLQSLLCSSVTGNSDRGENSLGVCECVLAREVPYETAASTRASLILLLFESLLIIIHCKLLCVITALWQWQ